MQNNAPRFATLQSLLAARARGTRRGHRHPTARNAIQGMKSQGLSMGLNAEKLCADSLPDFTPEELIYSHSQFPIYASFMRPAHRGFWAKQFAQGSIQARELFDQIEAAGAIEASSLRACWRCAVADEMTYGISYWRLFHQWPFIEHCPVHGCNLHASCCKCGAPYLRSQLLRGPFDPCDSCGMQLFDWEPQSRLPGNLALVDELMHRLQDCGRDVDHLELDQVKASLQMPHRKRPVNTT